MNSMENIAELLQSLLAENDFGKSDDENCRSQDDTAEEQGDTTDDFFGGIDIDMILKFGTLFAEMQKPDKNTTLLNALKPMMRTENREKIDTAVKLMRVMALLPLLRENGLMDKFF